MQATKPDSCTSSRSSIPRSLMLAGCILSLVCTGAQLCLAAPFDENLRAPSELNIEQDLRERARSYFDLFSSGSRTHLDVLRSQQLHSQWIELSWRLERALDTHSLGQGLPEFGITLRDNGSYTVNLREFPQWMPLDARLVGWFSPGGRGATLDDLRERGFRDSDIHALEAYLQVNPSTAGQPSVQAVLVETFAQIVENRAQRKRRLQRSDTMAFLYQRHRAVQEQERRWALGLLATLDGSRQKILEAYLMGQVVVRSMRATDMDQYLTELETGFSSGQILQSIRAERQEASR